MPQLGLRDWTLTFLRQLPFTDYSEVGDRLEAYWPGVHSLQYYRWVRVSDLDHVVATVLLRLESGGGLRSYYLGDVDHGLVKRISRSSISSGIVRRLQYGVDLITGHATKARCITADTGTIVELENDLPEPERRLFSALGQFLPNDHGSYYPIRWRFSQDFVREARATLLHLGIEVS